MNLGPSEYSVDSAFTPPSGSLPSLPLYLQMQRGKKADVKKERKKQRDREKARKQEKKRQRKKLNKVNDSKKKNNLTTRGKKRNITKMGKETKTFIHSFTLKKKN